MSPAVMVDRFDLAANSLALQLGVARAG